MLRRKEKVWSISVANFWLLPKPPSKATRMDVFVESLATRYALVADRLSSLSPSDVLKDVKRRGHFDAMRKSLAERWNSKDIAEQVQNVLEKELRVLEDRRGESVFRDLAWLNAALGQAVHRSLFTTLSKDIFRFLDSPETKDLVAGRVMDSITAILNDELKKKEALVAKEVAAAASGNAVVSVTTVEPLAGESGNPTVVPSATESVKTGRGSFSNRMPSIHAPAETEHQTGEFFHHKASVKVASSAASHQPRKDSHSPPVASVSLKRKNDHASMEDGELDSLGGNSDARRPFASKRRVISENGTGVGGGDNDNIIMLEPRAKEETRLEQKADGRTIVPARTALTLEAVPAKEVRKTEVGNTSVRAGNFLAPTAATSAEGYKRGRVTPEEGEISDHEQTTVSVRGLKSVNKTESVNIGQVQGTETAKPKSEDSGAVLESNQMPTTSAGLPDMSGNIIKKKVPIEDTAPIPHPIASGQVSSAEDAMIQDSQPVGTEGSIVDKKPALEGECDTLEQQEVEIRGATQIRQSTPEAHFAAADALMNLFSDHVRMDEGNCEREHATQDDKTGLGFGMDEHLDTPMPTVATRQEPQGPLAVQRQSQHLNTEETREFTTVNDAAKDSSISDAAEDPDCRTSPKLIVEDEEAAFTNTYEYNQMMEAIDAEPVGKRRPGRPPKKRPVEVGEDGTPEPNAEPVNEYPHGAADKQADELDRDASGEENEVTNKIIKRRIGRPSHWTSAVSVEPEDTGSSGRTNDPGKRKAGRPRKPAIFVDPQMDDNESSEGSEFDSVSGSFGRQTSSNTDMAVSTEFLDKQATPMTRCLKCKAAHLGCDKVMPKCGRCEKSGHDCQYPTSTGASSSPVKASPRKRLSIRSQELTIDIDTVGGRDMAESLMASGHTRQTPTSSRPAKLFQNSNDCDSSPAADGLSSSEPEIKDDKEMGIASPSKQDAKSAVVKGKNMRPTRRCDRCASVRQSCNKAWPKCGRCEDAEADCVYPEVEEDEDANGQAKQRSARPRSASKRAKSPNKQSSFQKNDDSESDLTDLSEVTATSP